MARLTESDLFGLAPEPVRQSALDYAQLGNVEHPRCSGDDLAAEVVGQRDVYHTRVSVRAGADGRPGVTASCTCPSHRMPCKHALAVLYAWVREPSDFVVLDELLADLQTRPAEDLLRALRDVALEDGGAAAALARTVSPRDWSAATPGEILLAWDVFRSWVGKEGHWPQAGVDLAARIEAGPPPVAARQLSWLLRLAAADLPAAVVEGALARLVSHLGDLVNPEAAVAATELALSLPADRSAEAEAVVRAASLGARELVEAVLQKAVWSARETLVLAGAAAASGSQVAARLARAEELLGAIKTAKKGRART